MDFVDKHKGIFAPPNSQICSQHFEPSCWNTVERKIGQFGIGTMCLLDDDAVPTLFEVEKDNTNSADQASKNSLLALIMAPKVVAMKSNEHITQKTVNTSIRSAEKIFESCTVCGNLKRGSVVLHKLPTSFVLKMKWLDFIEKTTTIDIKDIPLSKIRVCSAHFDDWCYAETTTPMVHTYGMRVKRFMLGSAVPSIFQIYGKDGEQRIEITQEEDEEPEDRETGSPAHTGTGNPASTETGNSYQGTDSNKSEYSGGGCKKYCEIVSSPALQSTSSDPSTPTPQSSLVQSMRLQFKQLLHKSVYSATKPKTDEEMFKLLSQKEKEEVTRIKEMRGGDNQSPRLHACKFLFCGEGFLTKELLSEHSKCHLDEPSIYTCCLCQARFHSYRSYDQHLINHFGVNRRLCAVCGQSLGSKSELHWHYSTMHNSRYMDNKGKLTAIKKHIKWDRFPRHAHSSKNGNDKNRESFEIEIDDAEEPELTLYTVCENIGASQNGPITLSACHKAIFTENRGLNKTGETTLPSKNVSAELNESGENETGLPSKDVDCDGCEDESCDATEDSQHSSDPESQTTSSVTFKNIINRFVDSNFSTSDPSNPTSHGRIERKHCSEKKTTKLKNLGLSFTCNASMNLQRIDDIYPTLRSCDHIGLNQFAFRLEDISRVPNVANAQLNSSSKDNEAREVAGARSDATFFNAATSQSNAIQNTSTVPDVASTESHAIKGTDTAVNRKQKRKRIRNKRFDTEEYGWTELLDIKFKDEPKTDQDLSGVETTQEPFLERDLNRNEPERQNIYSSVCDNGDEIHVFQTHTDIEADMTNETLDNDDNVAESGVMVIDPNNSTTNLTNDDSDSTLTNDSTVTYDVSDNTYPNFDKRIPEQEQLDPTLFIKQEPCDHGYEIDDRIDESAVMVIDPNNATTNLTNDDSNLSMTDVNSNSNITNLEKPRDDISVFKNDDELFQDHTSPVMVINPNNSTTNLTNGDFDNSMAGYVSDNTEQEQINPIMFIKPEPHDDGYEIDDSNGGSAGTTISFTNDVSDNSMSGDISDNNATNFVKHFPEQEQMDPIMFIKPEPHDDGYEVDDSNTRSAILVIDPNNASTNLTNDISDNTIRNFEKHIPEHEQINPTMFIKPEPFDDSYEIDSFVKSEIIEEEENSDQGNTRKGLMSKLDKAVNNLRNAVSRKRSVMVEDEACRRSKRLKVKKANTKALNQIVDTPLVNVPTVIFQLPESQPSADPFGTENNLNLFDGDVNINFVEDEMKPVVDNLKMRLDYKKEQEEIKTNKYFPCYNLFGPTEYKCDKPLCNEGFHHELMLQEHMKYHTEEKPIICWICSSVFQQYKTYSTHLSQHIGKETKTCQYCSSRFSSATLLNYHSRKNCEKKAELTASPTTSESTPVPASKPSNATVRDHILKKVTSSGTTGDSVYKKVSKPASSTVREQLLRNQFIRDQLRPLGSQQGSPESQQQGLFKCALCQVLFHNSPANLERHLLAECPVVKNALNPFSKSSRS